MLFTTLYVPLHPMVTADEPINPTETLGYEFLDNKSVFHMWNRFNHYYFNVSNGMQFTNHYNEYWSHNVMMIGYLTGENITDPDDWNLIYRVDELSGFTKRIRTDNQTYINITLWNDLSYTKGGNTYDFRLAIQYHLGVDDMDLSVTPYVKNLGIPIPFVTAFGWEVRDIKIGGIEYNSSIYINQTGYLLNQTPLDERYTNLTRVVMLWNETSQQNENVTIPNTIYTLYGGEHQHQELYLKWNGTQLKNKYLVWVKNRAGQYNAPVTLFLKIGTLNTGQEKYTTMHWLDSPDSVNLRPNAEGTVQQWTTYPAPDPPPPHWTLVDDLVGFPDEDTTYVYTGILDEIEDFNHETSALLTGATITNVRVNVRAKVSHIPTNINIGVRVGLTRYPAAAWTALTTSYINYYKDWANNPAPPGNPWTKSDIDALQSSLQAGAAPKTSVTQVYLTVTYTPGPPIITIDFAGNLGDSGGPYWRPPSENVQLTGAWSDGYYTNDSRQSEDWLYIHCTITSGVGIDTRNIWVNWLNETTWTNWTYLLQATGSPNSFYFNTSEMPSPIPMACGYNYSFNIVANDTNGLSSTSWWNKTGIGGGLTRRWVQLGCSQVNISYSPFYLVNYSSGTGTYPTYTSSDCDKKDRLHHDQGPDGTLTDTGYLNSTTPTETVHTRYCAAYLGYWFEDSVCNMPITVNNFHYHIWWTADAASADLFFDKSRAELDDISIDSKAITTFDEVSNITYSTVTYYLTTGLFTTTSTSFTDNDIYELNIGLFESSENPKTVCNRSFTSFVLPNVPDNATLNASHADSDSDGLSDWTELYVTYTNPFLADTDNDGHSDKNEYDSKTDPNDYTDIPREFLWIDVTNATWALGLIEMNIRIWTNETGKTFICDMDNTTVNTDLSLQITTDGATWHDGAAPASDVYRLNASIDTWSNEFLITEASDQTISSDITAYQNETFDLRFDAPTSTSIGVQQTITITATIVKH